MNKHAYLRAYMAGIAVPTPLLLVAMTAYAVFRLIYHFPVPVERFIVFPMAVVPNAWGAMRAFPILAPVALIVYYLAWKYLVGFLNRVLGLA
ncbi:MAG: hypothetical protein DMG42_33745 [Acidobacteria bacterium]|nr:MAG: hypothetical protein DMG42_33745 [Acidobacteriota bacterium]